MTTPIEDKIAKLLAKAEGTDNAHEAEAFTAMAEKLMLAHGVERAAVEGKRPGSVQQPIVIEKVVVKDGSGYAMALIQIAFAVAPSFDCRALQSSMHGGAKQAWFIGHKSDVEDAVALFNSLVTQAPKQALRWQKENQGWADRNEAFLARREFIFSFGSGVRERLTETRKIVVAETGAGTELVLVDRKKRVDSWLDANVGVSKKRATRRSSGGYSAAIAGHSAGRESVGQRSVEGQS